MMITITIIIQKRKFPLLPQSPPSSLQDEERLLDDLGHDDVFELLLLQLSDVISELCEQSLVLVLVEEESQLSEDGKCLTTRGGKCFS